MNKLNYTKTKLNYSTLCFQVQNTAFHGGYGSSFHFRNTHVIKVWGLSFHIWNICFPGSLGCNYHNIKTNLYSREFSFHIKTILREVRASRELSTLLLQRQSCYFSHHHRSSSSPPRPPPPSKFQWPHFGPAQLSSAAAVFPWCLAPPCRHGNTPVADGCCAGGWRSCWTPVRHSFPCEVTAVLHLYCLQPLYFLSGTSDSFTTLDK